MAAVAGVVIPAHNEERVIARTLERLADGVSPGDLDVVVVCNGCTDRTATVARAAAPWARVLDVPKPSKVEAVRVGNAAGTVFPRVHLDADVAISGADVLNLVQPLREPGVLATAPQRVLVRDRSSRLVRWFYDVWEQLPQVRTGLFGRGVVAVSEEGQRRVDGLPRLMSDDLAISEVFEPGERRVVWTAFAEVRAPGTFRDLIRRRVRVATGNAQAVQADVRRPESSTTLATLARLSLRKPSLAPRVPLFLLVGVVARLQSRRAVRSGDFTTWLRDESSRA
ncbi:MAG TPA: glycosyltransferase [Nocardioides sp.]|uniref:glycosyltransferase n=1 Tax=Nocardioides sp. TaxID=35761 RepID=UPI002E355F46|nr:glycosyltransferase [Nocardioides sp.]HEX5089000.1 glycosyltransferase [Nocardioides sp.]